MKKGSEKAWILQRRQRTQTLASAAGPAKQKKTVTLGAEAQETAAKLEVLRKKRKFQAMSMGCGPQPSSSAERREYDAFQKPLASC